MTTLLMWTLTAVALVVPMPSGAASAVPGAASAVPRVARSAHARVARSSHVVAVAQMPEPATEAAAAPTAADDGILTWSMTKDGIRYVDERVGTGAVPDSDAIISVHYKVSYQESGDTLGTSRGRWPLTFAPAKHAVPLFSDGIEGMRIGGVRRLHVPPGKIPASQVRNVPLDQEGEALRIEIELLGVETGLKALIPSLLAPGGRRLTIARAAFALSFLPYFLPEDSKPEWYQAGDVNEITARREEQAKSVWLGGAAQPLEQQLDALFPVD